MTARTAPTLRERVKTPGLQAAMQRAAARLAAEEAGWVIMEPGEAKALESVARAAEYEGWGADHHEVRSKGTCRLCRALARLDRTRAPRGSGKRRGRA